MVERYRRDRDPIDLATARRLLAWVDDQGVAGSAGTTGGRGGAGGGGVGGSAGGRGGGGGAGATAGRGGAAGTTATGGNSTIDVSSTALDLNVHVSVNPVQQPGER